MFQTHTMPSLTQTQELKIRLLTSGLAVEETARHVATNQDSRPLTLTDYATTGGLTVVLPGNIFVNAPLRNRVQPDSIPTLIWDKGEYGIVWDSKTIGVEVLPLPYYSIRGRHPGVMTHADRVRLSPVSGCACTCAFCDSPFARYSLADTDSLVTGLAEAMEDTLLPARHALISGGTPRRSDQDWLDAAYKKIIETSPISVDVMLMPRETVAIVDSLVSWGAHGLSINLELHNRELAQRWVPQKAHASVDAYSRSLSRAVELLGSGGKVRSLLIVGLEPVSETLKGVELLASLGVDPVLSPFRPAMGTALSGHPAPDEALLSSVYLEAMAICDAHGMHLGPRCIPCQHNVLAFPDDSGAYYFS